MKRVIIIIFFFYFEALKVYMPLKISNKTFFETKRVKIFTPEILKMKIIMFKTFALVRNVLAIYHD